MPLEITVPLATFVVFFLGRLAFGRGRHEHELEPDAAAKRFIEARIDEHVEFLAMKYLQTRPPAGDPETSAGCPDPREQQDAPVEGDDISRWFASEIEAFIARVVLEDERLSAIDDVEIKSAIREVVVLNRQYVYEQVLARVRRHIGRLDDTAIKRT
jgi:hypothetical protein